MADFNSEFWHWYIALLTIASILGCIWLLIWMSSGKPPAGEETMTSGHTWDGDLTELNNPMPRWWLGLFYISIAFSGFYLLLYPGLGSFGGLLEWSSSDEYKQEVAEVEARVGPLFARYQQQDIASLSQDADANRIGERLFASYCATCHGADARGARGFPNLRDGDWLWGGEPEQIKASIRHGRQGLMPAWKLPLGGDTGVEEVTQYLLSLSGRATLNDYAVNGEKRFKLFCVACHGQDAGGNIAMGAPNLRDNTWLYGGSASRIAESIANGRNGQMPAHGDFLGEAKLHLLTAYIYGLGSSAR